MTLTMDTHTLFTYALHFFPLYPMLPHTTTPTDAHPALFTFFEKNNICTTSSFSYLNFLAYARMNPETYVLSCIPFYLFINLCVCAESCSKIPVEIQINNFSVR